MRALTLREINSLTNRPGIQRTTIENFLVIIKEGMEKKNLIRFARQSQLYYAWNKATYNAIVDGIHLAEELNEGKHHNSE